MRRLLLFGVCVLLCGGAFAHSQAEELLVAQSLVRMIMSSSGWNDNLKPSNVADVTAVSFPSYDDLFSACYPTNTIGSTWTPAERKAAFEGFVDSIPDLSTNGLYGAIGMHAVVALNFCREHGATNTLNAAMKILSASDSVAQGTAFKIFEDLARPTDAVNDYVVNQLTNGLHVSAQFKDQLLWSHVRILSEHENECLPTCFTNGIRLAISAVTNRDGAKALDWLLMDTYPDYADSSNRMALAMIVLSDSRPGNDFYRNFIDSYFIQITNQLQHATQPLPEVEALRGL